MPRKWTHQDLGVDANGCLTEGIEIDGQKVVVHYDDLPDSDVTTVHGLACTTPLRTVIDIAADLDRAALERVVRDCLGRGLFTTDEAMARLTQPDMTSRRGAHLLRTLLEP